MDVFSPRSLKNASGEALHRSVYPPQKLVLIHTGVTLLVNLLLAVAHFLLSREIAKTGGLAGIGTRSILSSVQMLVQMVISFLLPFWELGLTYCIIRMARRQRYYPDELTTGFQKFFPLLRLMLMEALLIVALAFVATQASTMLMSFTSYGETMIRDMQALMDSEEFMRSGTIPEEMLEGMMRYMKPMLLVAGAAFVVGGAFLLYRFRFSRHAILDNRCTGPVDALRTSWTLTKGHTGQLFSLDLSYWWYYLLQLVVAAVAYIDLLFPVLGVSLSENVAFFIVFGVHLILSFALAVACRAKVDTTYACLYLHLLPPEEPEE